MRKKRGWVKQLVQFQVSGKSIELERNNCVGNYVEIRSCQRWVIKAKLEAYQAFEIIKNLADTQRDELQAVTWLIDGKWERSKQRTNEWWSDWNIKTRDKPNPAVVELKSQTSGNRRRTRMLLLLDSSLAIVLTIFVPLSRATESKLRHVTRT